MSDVIGGSILGPVPFNIPDTAQQAFLEACYLEADRINGVLNSPHRELFMEAVIVAIQHDRMVESADTLGYINDPTSPDESMMYFRRNSGVVTYNGNSY